MTADGWLRTEVQNGRQRVGRVESVCWRRFPRYLGVGGIVKVTPSGTERKRTGPFRTGEDVRAPLQSLFLPFSLSGDRGVPGWPLLAVMDGLWRSTVAAVIGYR